MFKHALTQEVAGNSLLSEQRGELHERTARAIEALFSRQLKDHYNELAHHYSLSGNVAKAVEYLHWAGRQALERSAHLDAIRHLSMALELLKRQADTPERALQELILRVTLGPALLAARGYASPEVEANYTRALSLCEESGEAAQLFQVKLGLRTFFLIRAQHKTAYELSEALLSLAENSHDPVLLGQAHVAVGGAALFLGEFRTARTHMEQGLAYYDPRQHPTHAALYGQDPGVRGLCYLTWVLWYLGFPVQASKKAQEALALAQKASHPFSLARALVFTAEMHQYRNEVQLARGCAEAAIAVSTEHGFPFWLVWGTILRGWALAEQECREEGIAQMRQGLTAYHDTGAKFGRPYFLALLAQTYGNAGQIQAGLDALAEALAFTSNTGERYYEAELYRLKGELFLQGSSAQPCISKDRVEAEGCFHRAIAIARQQSAKSLELRATFSLARLWEQQGKKEVARQILSRLHEAYTEGFDTRDWQQAKDLLNSLV
ncbi:TOMM system kinase/cyclase fusion protein [compost metagenome]